MKNVSSKSDFEWLRDDMPTDCYWFWVTKIGKDKMSGSWDHFIGVYQLLYGPLEPMTRWYFRQLFCNRNDEVSIFRVITAARNSNGFPFCKDMTMTGNSNSLSTFEPE